MHLLLVTDYGKILSYPVRMVRVFNVELLHPNKKFLSLKLIN